MRMMIKASELTHSMGCSRCAAVYYLDCSDTFLEYGTSFVFKETVLDGLNLLS